MPGSSPAAPLLGDRFRCDQLLKEGSGVETFAGTDIETGGAVIVKRIADVGFEDRVWSRLSHEADVLRRLETTALRAPITMGREQGYFYLVRPAVDGVTLAERLASGPLPIAAAVATGIGLLEALQHAHDHHVLHRDVKPGNVIVNETGEAPTRRVVLIDFGFARSPTLDSTVRDERVGTARYLAPEAAGLLERDVDERSDLYSLGVVLFECVAGHPPFEGTDVGDVLRQHLNATPASLRELRPDVPRALDAVIQRLLRKDPDERYQSAAAASADLSAIADGLRTGVADPSVVIGVHDRRQVLTEPAFVGRAAELQLLAQVVAEARGGEGGLVLLEAESGGGKSRVLDELALKVQSEAWVLRGQGVDQTGQRPFQLLEGVVRGIAAAANADPAVGAMIRSRVADRAEAIAAALPDLASTLRVDIGAANLGPEAYGETRSLNALKLLLNALGSDARAAVVLLDDCQWADAPTLKLLAEWNTDADDTPTTTVVVAAFRTEEAPEDYALRHARAIAAIRLPAFAASDVQNLAESMAGTLPNDVLETVALLSEGSPFMAGAVLRGLVEAGALIKVGDEWRTDASRLADAQTSRRAALFLVRRLELLAPATLELLSAGAILGKEFDLELALQLCGQTRDQADVALAEAASRRIVWPKDNSGRIGLLHDKLREALLSRLGEAESEALHLEAAKRIEAVDPTRVFELAYHFSAAKRADLALTYALRAAESARGQHSLDVALTNYRIAEAAVAADPAGTDVSLQALIAEALGDVLTLKGAYEEATTQLEVALAQATTDLARATLRGKLGEVAFKRGDQRRARAHLEDAVRALGQRLPRNPINLALSLLREVLVQIVHTAAPSLTVGRRSPEGAEREFRAMRLYSRLAYVYWFSAGKTWCAWAHLRGMNLAERYPPSAEMAQAYSEHAPVMTIAPWFGRSIKYAERSLAIRVELGDLWGQGQSLNFFGVALYAASRQREAIDKLEEAVRLLDQTGDRWEANTAAWNIAFARYRLGELAEAVRMARRLHEAATAIGDQTAAGTSLSAWSRASAGQVPAALIRAQLDQGNDDAQTDADVHVAEGVRLLACEDYDAAVAVFAEAVRIVKSNGLRQEYVAHVQPWLATALRCQAEAISPHDVATRRAILRQAKRAASRGWRVAFFYRNNAPHALRERGLLAAIDGHKFRARRLLARSLAAATQQDAAYEQLLTQQAWASTGLSVLGVPAAEALATAQNALSQLVPEVMTVDPQVDAGPPATLSLLDRFATVLAVGRKIASASSATGVYEAVEEASQTLLRGEHCEVLRLADAALEGDSAKELSPRGASRTLVKQALAELRPVVLAQLDGESVDSTDSIVLSGVRSALCAPILSQGAPVALVYVSHTGIDGLFGADEIQMTEFITTLAGAALEHVANTEARFRSLAQNSSDVITIVDRSGAITYQSAAVTRVFGWEPDALVGQRFVSWVHADDVAEVTELLETLSTGTTGARLFECRLRRRDGGWLTVETALNDFNDDSGVEGFVLNTRDVTDRKTAEAELRQTLSDLTMTSSLLNATLDATVDGILVVDREGRITSFNQQFAQLWDIPQDILVTRDDTTALSFVLERLVDPDAFLAKVDALYTEPDADSFDTFELKDGRTFERVSQPQRIGDAVVGRVWSFRDVTERARVEHDLAFARDRAMEASRLKSEFVATTSHEIRTPMNGVIGLTNLLLETELDATQREYADAVRLSAEALLGVINDILDFSKIEAGKLELEVVSFDLRSALEDVTSLVARAAQGKGLVLRWRVEPDVATGLRGDVSRLRQILLNLLANAVKFTSEGEVTVHVTNAAPRGDGSLVLRFDVTDTGAGIKPDDRDRLFEAFSQGDASTTRRYGGTGLGLAICRRLAEAMGGSITVASTLGVGSTFSVEIPFGRSNGKPRPTVTNASRTRTRPPRAAGGRVLVAEDNAINQLVARQMIRKLGYECDVVANGSEAVEALKERAYAVVLMDCYMPEMDGFVATQRIRDDEGCSKHTPVIAMTALAMAEDRQRCREAGMDDYVSKPVSFDALRSALEQWITVDTA